MFCRMGNIVNHLCDQQPELCIKYGTLFLTTVKRKLSGLKILLCIMVWLRFYSS